jgi:hypothetical protein
MRHLLTTGLIITSLLLSGCSKTEVKTEGKVTAGYVEDNRYYNSYFGMTLETEQDIYGPSYFERIGIEYSELEKMNQKRKNMISIPLMVIPFDQLNVDSSNIQIVIASDAHFEGDRNKFYKAMNFRFEDEDESITVYNSEIGGIACKTSQITEGDYIYSTSIIEAGDYYLVVYTTSGNEEEHNFIANTLARIEFTY